MPDPLFLTKEQVQEIHRHQITIYGGSHGLRGEGLLDSALAVPRATFGGQFLHSDIWEMAAAYLYHLCQDHPFVDGNKRTAAMAALFFLHINGSPVRPGQDAYEGLVRGVAESRTTKEEVAQFFRDQAQQATSG